MILYTKYPKNTTRTFLKPVNPFSEVAEHKNDTQKTIYKWQTETKKETKKTLLFTV